MKEIIDQGDERRALPGLSKYWTIERIDKDRIRVHADGMAVAIVSPFSHDAIELLLANMAEELLSAAQPVAQEAIASGYVLISIDALRVWGKLDEVQDACKYSLAAPQPSQGAEEALALGLKTRAFQDVVYERMRQCRVEGWTPMHDDEHTDGSLSVAAACYALAELNGKRPSALSPLYLWKFTGWDESWWKPAGRRRNLVKAGALILAELERLDRAGEKK